MEKCKRCGSFAINENSHGRESGKDLHLCYVCYWRKMEEQLDTTACERCLETYQKLPGATHCGFCGRPLHD